MQDIFLSQRYVIPPHSDRISCGDHMGSEATGELPFDLAFPIAKASPVRRPLRALQYLLNLAHSSVDLS